MRRLLFVVLAEDVLGALTFYYFALKFLIILEPDVHRLLNAHIVLRSCQSQILRFLPLLVQTVRSA